jgi:hypothetical protein
VSVNEYVPAGLVFEAASNTSWALVGGIPQTTIAGPIAAGSSSMVTVILKVDGSATGAVQNFAEIGAADDDTNSGNTPPTDIDSSPDSNPSNDTNGGDDVTNNAGGDSDDHDFASITVLSPALASLGDYVWYDADKDGQQDSLETGVAGVIVKIYDSNKVLIGTDTTDANGKYLFTNLTSGD